MSALDTYLVKKRESTTAFAARIGCDKATISRIRRGLQQPTLPVAQKIISGTDGRLCMTDLMRRRQRRNKRPEG